MGKGKTYLGSVHDPARLSHELTPFFVAVCDRVKPEYLPSQKRSVADKQRWHGRCLFLYLKSKVRTSDWGKDNTFDQQLRENGRTFGTLSQMPSAGSGPEMAEIAICTAAELTSSSSLDAFLLGYVKACISEGWDQHIPFLDEDFPDLVGRVRAEMENDPQAPRALPSAEQPVLSDPPKMGGIFYYGNRKLEVIGRKQEQKRLREFLDCDMPFAWFQVAGVAGQGKSRLAFELVARARKAGWSAGLLEPKHYRLFQGSWLEWQPDKAHLIVFDYVVGREDAVRKLMEAFSCRRSRFRENVRFLLVERQRWDSGGIHKKNSDQQESQRTEIQDDFSSNVFEDRAEWFLKLCDRPDGNDGDFQAHRFQDGVLELTALDQTAQVELVKEVSAFAGGQAIEGGDKWIRGQLKHIDPEGRPLFAYFLGAAIAESGLTKKWAKESLLTEALYRNINFRWFGAIGAGYPELGDDHLALKVALVATMTGGLDCAEAAAKSLLPRLDKKTRREAIVFADGPIGGGADGVGQSVPNLQPDLLGEWFVLHACGKGQDFENLMDVAWRYAPKAVAEFLVRLAQDFPDHVFTEKMIDYPPPDSESDTALTKATAAICGHLYTGGYSLPIGIFRALEKAADAGDGLAMRNLGSFYGSGWGVEQNWEQAVHWFHKGSNAGDGLAMLNLGVCYAKGQGVEQDFGQAFHWFQKGSDAGEGRSKNNLGVCYAKGLGVEQNWEQAVHWFQKAANSGVGVDQAMNTLALCYETGQGVEQDFGRAFHWYKKGAIAGHGAAMTNLAGCYAKGQGVELDLDKAMYWYKKGADSGDIQAMFDLGDWYREGRVEQDWEKAVDWYQKAADAGDGPAMNNLGVCYENGRGVEQSWENAFHWYQKAANAGHGPAMNTLGLCYQNGQGVSQDYGRAFHWYTKGAEDDDGSAMNSLGICYANGRGVEQNWDRAVQWYQKAADAGDVLAMSNLGDCYAYGLGIEQDWEKAALWYQKAADIGDGLAMNSLGLCYEKGLGVEQSWVNAVHWYQMGSDVGEGQAMCNLGLLYEKGQAVEQDWKQAVHWYRKAASLDVRQAITNLGVCYATGLGVEQDWAQAVFWFQNGSDLGEGRAMHNLGVCYKDGLGVKQDWERAAYWFQKGSDAGDGRAMNNLGFSYAQGEGVAQDLELALYWYTKAAEAGEGPAMLNLGIRYEKGQGVEQDWEKAFYWYQKGAEVGDGRAMVNLGVCYENGWGVKQDQKQAVHLYRQAADAGYGLAMNNLGDCYKNGWGVTQDSVQADYWYQKASKAQN